MGFSACNKHRHHQQQQPYLSRDQRRRKVEVIDGVVDGVGTWDADPEEDVDHVAAMVVPTKGDVLSRRWGVFLTLAYVALVSGLCTSRRIQSGGLRSNATRLNLGESVHVCYTT